MGRTKERLWDFRRQTGEDWRRSIKRDIEQHRYLRALVQWIHMRRFMRNTEKFLLTMTPEMEETVEQSSLRLLWQESGSAKTDSGE